MTILGEIGFLLRISRSSGIARRYFVTNGFDGALTMLGLTMGFRIGGEVPMSVALSACMGTAIALAMSGLSSAYISEAAERERELKDLEGAMLAQLDASAHARAARLAPFFIALVNSLAPLLFSLMIMLPVWLAHADVSLPWKPFDMAIAVASLLIFLMGIFLGSISGRFWLWSGLRTLVVALVTLVLIQLFSL